MRVSTRALTFALTATDPLFKDERYAGLLQYLPRLAEFTALDWQTASEICRSKAMVNIACPECGSMGWSFLDAAGAVPVMECVRLLRHVEWHERNRGKR